MLDQTKMLSGERNPIMELVNEEKNIKKIDAEGPITVQLANDGKTLLLTHGGLNLHSNVNRPIIHQLGGRAWGRSKEFKQIDTIWHKKFSKNPSDLEQELASVFRENDLSIRYATNSRGKNSIYGIVTPHFVDVNQLEFRRQFIEQVQKNDSLKAESSGITRSYYGDVTEFSHLIIPAFKRHSDMAWYMPETTVTMPTR